MKSVVEEFYEILKHDRKASEWSASATIAQRASQIKEELDEMIDAIKNEDDANLKEELGDIFWDLLALCVIIEEEKGFTKEDAIKDAIDKYHRRKPFIKEGRSVSAEEESVIWHEIKKKEKESKKR